MNSKYTSMGTVLSVNRRSFMRGACTMVVGGAVLGVGGCTKVAEQEEADASAEAVEIKTNLAEFMKVPKASGAIPGPYPGRVVQVSSEACVGDDDTIDAAIVEEMLDAGLERLGSSDKTALFNELFSTDDVVGLKVNPVGAPRISTRLEVTESVIKWLVDSGLPKNNIVIWDRFEGGLEPAGYSAANFPGVRIEGMQMMDEQGDSWRTEDGRHISEDRFNLDAYYLAEGIFGKGVRGYQSDEFYLNQHVFNGEYSYFGKLVTDDLTKIINLPVFKNTGNGVSIATKNLGYGAICNCGRLHQPLFFRVCTHVLAAPWIRDKLVLNITDGLRGQYEGGPGLNEQFVYPQKALYFATDPFAMDMVCHRQIVAKRKEMKIQVNEHPKYTEYLYEAQDLGLGIVDPEKIDHETVTV